MPAFGKDVLPSSMRVGSRPHPLLVSMTLKNQQNAETKGGQCSLADNTVYGDYAVKHIAMQVDGEWMYGYYCGLLILCWNLSESVNNFLFRFNACDNKSNQQYQLDYQIMCGLINN